jgi:hypothetical protein
MKGFAGLLFVFAVIILAGVLLSLNFETKSVTSNKEILSETKMFTSNFSIMLTQVVYDCNTQIYDINSCVDSNAPIILQKIKPSFLDCNKTSSTKNGTDNNIASFILNCKGEKYVGGESAVYIDLNKYYSIKK